MLPLFTSFADELTKIALNVSAAPELVKLITAQERLAPIEGSNLPGRIRYLKLKAQGGIPRESNVAPEPSGMSTSGDVTKMGAVGGDLRLNGLGGVKRPPFPTDDSVRRQSLNLSRQQNVGKFKERVSERMLSPDGPSITQSAPMIGSAGKIKTPALTPRNRL